MKLSIVTGNSGKYEQIARGLPNFLEVEQAILDISEIQTSLLTEISRDKCIKAFEQLWKPCLVDDSGIYFDAFHEFPGALSKFIYQWIGLEGIKRLYDSVEDVSAYFQCVLSYMDETMEEPLQFIWEVSWTLSFDWMGLQEENIHLPYDLIFVPTWFDKPALFEWKKWSDDNHRTRAVKKFGDFILQR